MCIGGSPSVPEPEPLPPPPPPPPTKSSANTAQALANARGERRKRSALLRGRSATIEPTGGGGLTSEAPTTLKTVLGA